MESCPAFAIESSRTRAIESRRNRAIESRRTRRIESRWAFAAESRRWEGAIAAAFGGGDRVVSSCARRWLKINKQVSRIIDFDKKLRKNVIFCLNRSNVLPGSARFREILMISAKLKKAYVPQMNFSIMKIKWQFTRPSFGQR